MSRRKQARPRLCKREDDEELSDKEGGRGVAEPEAKVLKLSDDKENGGKPVVNGNSGPPESVRCETCSAVFDNLVQFMDHRNFECEAAGGISWKDDDRSESPLSTDSTNPDVDDTLPDSVTLEPVDVPYNLGVDEAHPQGCEFCDRAFEKVSLLKIHEQVHSDKLPFKCGDCYRRFRHKRSRDRHVKQHTGIKKYKCASCDASFIRSDHLRSHMKTHENPSPSASSVSPQMTSHKMGADDIKTEKSKCSKCNAEFETVQQKTDHICSSVLAGMKTIACPLCSAICVGQTALSLHIEHAHSTDTQEYRKCPLCNKNCQSFEDLAVHIKIHNIGVPHDHEIASSSDMGPTDFQTGILASPGAKNFPKDFLVCPYCLREDFETLESLEVHMQGVHSVKPTEVYTCNYCNAPYKNLYSLHEHMRAVHQNQPSMGIKYPCSRCGKEYPSIEALQDHKKRMHRSKQMKNINAIYCTMCMMTFGSTQSLSEHVKLAHKQSTAKIKDDQTPTLKTPKYQTSDKDGLPTDIHTIINVPEPSHLLRHLKTPPSSHLNLNSFGSAPTPKPPPLSPVGKLSPGANYYKPLSTPPASSDRGSTKLTCDQCNSTFFDVSTYQTHTKCHIDAALGQFACKKCNKLFLTEEDLERHLSSHFLSVMSEYGCTSCSKTFGKPDELQKHLIDIHAHHLYRCSLCKEIFDSKVNIQVHFAIKHSNECKLYKCVQCDTVFRSEAEWQVHVRVAHLHMSKPYRCLFCKESFTTEMDLQCHLATHNKPFKCSMCDESFLVEFLLDKHLQNAHSGAPSTISPCSATSSLERSTPGIKIKIKCEQSPETVKPALTLDGPAAYPDILITEGSLYAGISSSSDGSLVWRSSDDLYRCNICDMKFSKLSGLQTHKIQDHGVKLSTILSQYSPPMPGQTSSSQAKKENGHSELAKHASDPDLGNVIPTTSALTDALKSTMLLPVHVPESQSTFSEKLSSAFSERENLACTFCSQTFKCRADLEKHSKIHLNTGSQKCNICDETFASTGILAEHKLTHCKIQQGNVCVICKIGLKSEDHFYLHSQEHGFQGAVMQCIVCRQTLASLLELQMHGRHHFQSKSTFHTCCVCLKSFASNENLVSKLNSTGRTYYVCKPCYHGDTSEFTCSQCSVSFSSALQLESHMTTHKRTYQCIKCQESFSSEQEIQIHVTTHMMTEGNAHECHLCFTVLDSPARLQCHLIEHTYRGTDYMCSVCGKILENATEIQLHALEHGISARRYGCNQCSQKFFFSAELENHMFTHRYTFSDQSANAKSSVNQSTLGKLLTSQAPTSSSSKLKTGTQTSAIPSSSAAEDLKCSECDKTFNNITNLTNHYKQHEKRVTQIQCSHCVDTFPSVTELQAHFFSQHTSTDLDTAKSVFICPTCQDIFTEEEALKEHRKTHNDDKKFQCSECRRMFGTAKLLANHVKSHSEDKPFQCHVCEKRFSRKENKSKHMKLHHVEDSPFACAVCARPFKRREAVKEHMKIHCLQTDPSTDETAIEIDTNSGSSEETAASSNTGSGVSEEDSSDADSGEQVTSTSNLVETEEKI